MAVALLLTGNPPILSQIGGRVLMVLAYVAPALAGCGVGPIVACGSSLISLCATEAGYAQKEGAPALGAIVSIVTNLALAFAPMIFSAIASNASISTAAWCLLSLMSVALVASLVAHRKLLGKIPDDADHTE